MFIILYIFFWYIFCQQTKFSFVTKMSSKTENHIWQSSYHCDIERIPRVTWVLRLRLYWLSLAPWSIFCINSWPPLIIETWARCNLITQNRNLPCMQSFFQCVWKPLLKPWAVIDVCSTQSISYLRLIHPYHTINQQTK